MRFAARAIFSDRPPEESDDVWAETPVAAARKWFWSWPAEQRGACERIRISAFPAGGPKPWPYYEGPDVVYDPREKFAEVKR